MNIPWKKYLIGELSWRRLMHSFLFIYSFLFLFAWFFGEKILFPAPPARYEKESTDLIWVGEGSERIAALERWNPSSKHVILFSHGNGEDLGDLGWYLDDLAAAGFSVLAYDYPGYGQSAGKAGEATVCRAANQVFEYLTVKRHVNPKQIILMGRSVGGGPTLDLAVRHHVGGVILESPFITAFRTVTRIPILPFDHFRNIDKIDRIDCPLLILHGTRDRVIPFEHGKKLFEKAKEPKQFIPAEGAGHNDILEHLQGEYFQILNQFSNSIP